MSALLLLKSRLRLTLLVVCLGAAVLAPSQCAPFADPDLNDDGTVNILDVSLLGSCLGLDPATDAGCQDADPDCDGDVDQDDLGYVVANFGQTGFEVDEDCPPDDVVTADPSERGPFGVGVWESSVEDHIALDGTPRPLPLLVWYPTEAEGEADTALKGIIDALPSDAGPFPVIAFSYGYEAFPAQSTFLMEHMATHGFVVVAMGHPDGAQGRDESFMNRPGEVRAAVEFVLEESAREGALLHGAADGSRLGVMGHSFGGLTTLAALAKPDNPFKAGLAMAPGIRPRDAFDVRDDLPDIIDPIMFMMGRRDPLAWYPDLTAAYAILPESTERYAFIFRNGNHFAYSDGCPIFCFLGSLDRALGHQLVNTYATAFMQVRVGGQNDFDAYLQPADDIAGGEARLIRGALP